MSKTQSLVRAPLAATRSMVPGGLSERSRQCGTPAYQCAHDATYRHGPPLDLTYREDETSRSVDVPPEPAERARAARDAWASFGTIGYASAALNREAVRRQWQGAPALPARRARRRASGD